QKRRRVTRACDECRRKKIKCDGKQPCTHCTVYSYECTYDQPSNRRRNAAPQYVEALENQLKRAKAMLSILIPNVDLTDPSLDTSIAQGNFPNLRSQVGGLLAHNAPRPAPERPPLVAEASSDAQLESMVQQTGQLDLDEQGHWDYHGHSSGLSFVRRMREQLGDIVGPEGQGTPFMKSRPYSQVLDSPKSSAESPMDAQSAAIDLPSREIAKAICEHALNDASALLPVVHQPTFFKAMDQFYDTPPEQYSNRENSFLPLLYAVLALGTLFATEESKRSSGYESAIHEGFKFFKASRQLMDIADCRDLTSLQAVVFMILFLQSSAKLSTCYAYIGVALRSALRMGLHRHFQSNFNPIEAETRKRVFWVIRKMDTYVGALLGLPHFLSDDDVDQEFPAEVDDEYITETEIKPMPEGIITVVAGANAHTRIVQILAKIVRYIYPIKGEKTVGPQEPSDTENSYTVSYAKIREIEYDLQAWMENLPMGLKPGGDAPPVIIRVRQLLRISYGHAQMMLYRPFLHYISSTAGSSAVDQRSFKCAAACVSVSRNIIHITAEMKRQNLLVGAYWFAMYTTFFAIISLVFYAIENPDSSASQNVLRDAIEGKETLAQLAKYSMAADRCNATLSALFEQLPERLKRGREPSASNKRSRPIHSPSPLPPGHPTQSATEVHRVGVDMEPQPPIRRASTFPEHIPPLVGKRASLHQGLHLGSPFPVESQFIRPLGSETSETTPSLTSASATTSSSSLPFGTPQRNVPGFVASPAGDFLSPHGLPDFSSTMFPSADPFAYPNPAFATLDNSSFSPFGSTQGNPFLHHGTPTSHPNQSNRDSTMFASPISGHTPTPPEIGKSDAGVQLYGPLPMYMMPGVPHAGQVPQSMRPPG
ncbi:hypothetical protein M501DRAFT_920741, partial [Patellaria atrata CBS 101060]